MKKINLIEWLWKTDSHEKQSPQRFARYAAMLIMLLTLGVGQMWADNGDFYNMYIAYSFEGAGGAIDGADNNTGVTVDAGTLTSGSLTLTGVYLKCWDDWGSNYKSSGGQLCYTNKGGSTQYISCTRSGKSGNNYEYQNSNPGVTLASYNQASGSFEFHCWGQTWGWGDRYFPKSSGHYVLKYKIAPPAVSGFTITPSGEGYVSGTGTESDPYIMKHDAGNLVLTMSGSKAHTDANSSAKYYNGSSWSATATKTIAYASGSTTKESVTLKMKYNNSTASLDGAESSIKVYYQRESTNTVSASASPAAGGSVTPSSSTTTGQKSGIAISASNNTGYTFSGWSIVSGSGSFVSSTTTASNRFKPTSNTSLRATFTAKNYTVTLNKNGGDSNGSVQTTYNSSSTSSFTGASRAGYSCDGYFTDPSTGSKVINADGTLVSGTVSGWLSSGNWVKDAASITLYAHWTEDITNYTVTYAVKSDQTSLGSLSCAKTVGGAAVSSGSEVASGTGVTFTASPITGYEVDAWCSNPACTTPIAGAGYANTYATSVTADLGVYVKFKKKIYTITYSPSSAPTGCTYTTKPTTGTYGNTVTMVITPSTGYTVSVSARDASSNVVTISNPSANTYTFTQPASAVTVTVTATETKSTITVTTATSSQGTLKFGSTSKSWGATASLGVATTQEITATAAAGFRFVRWDLSGAAASASTLTNATITLKADGSGSTGTATAVFEEDLSSPWIVAGGNKIVTTGTTWRTTADANNTMLKKTGHSTESVVYFTVPVTTVCSGDNNGNFQFKIYNTSTSKWYGLFASGSYYLLKAEDGTEKSLVEDNQNIELRAYVTGDYVLKLDYSTSTPKLTVTWPVYNQVRISAASPSDAGNVGNYDLSDPVSNVRTVTRSLKANTTYTFKIMYNSDWYGFNSGTFTRSNSTSSNSRTINTSGGNMTLTTDYAGDYTFKFNQSTKALSIDFPEAYKVTYGKGAVDGSSGNNCSAVDIDNSRASVTSNSTWVLSGHKVELTAPAAKSGYTYNGWFDNNSGTGDAITTNANCTITVSSALTRYACYTINNHAITHSASSHGTYTIKVGSAAAVSTNTTSDYGKTITLAATPATGYHFGSWSAYKTGTPATTVTVTSNQFTMPDYAVTVGATFSPTTYSITYHTNGGSAIATGNYNIETATFALPTTSEKTGYTFAGWYTNSELTGDPVASIEVGSYGNKEYWAKWTPNTYTVSFDVNGGTASAPDSKEVTFGSAYGTLPGGMTHASKTFVGWYDDPDDGEGTHITAETIVSTAENHTLYAHYENVYSVNVNFKCGSDVIYPATSVDASPTSLAPTITAPEIFGYSFENWTGTNVTFADASSATTTITATAATSVTANYSVVPTVYFKNNLGWENVYVTFDSYWKEVGGKQVPGNKGKPYYKMTQIGSSDVYYCVIPETYTTSDYAGWAWNIAFDNTNYGSTAETTHTGIYDPFYGGKFTGRGDFDPKATMFIPYNGDTETRNGGTFYKSGCWMKYNSTESGYQVKMNEWVTGAHAELSTTNLTAPAAGGYEFSATVYLGTANYSYGFKLYKEYQKNTNDLWYTNTGDITSATDNLPWAFWSGSEITADTRRCGLHTEALGDYKITVSFATGKPMVSVEYPVSTGDWKLIYKDLATWSGDAHTASWNHPSRVIKAKADAEDIVSFYVAHGSSPSIELYKCTAIDAGTGAETWTKQSDVSLTGISKKGVYNFKVSQNGSKVATVTLAGEYDGNFYIRTDASNGGWTNYKTSGKNLMTYSEYSLEHGGDFGPYSHYFMRFASKGTNIKFCLANDYSECITDTVVDDTYTGEFIAADGNVRFMWNSNTNKIGRTYISGSSVVSDRFLVLEGDAKMFDESGNVLTTAGGGKISGLNDYEMKFTDDENWIYEATVKAQPGARIKLTAKYNDKIQYFYGEEGERSEATTDLLIGGSGSDKYKMRIVYDFKTNRLMRAFIPDATITTDLAINADLMIIREHQEQAQQISFSGDGALSDVKTVYGAMKFNKYTVNGKSKESGHASTGASRYERDLFYISFPFDVKLGDAFGFGEYGKHWIIEYYDGKGRAEKGFWADSEPNWKFVWPAQRSSFTMKAFEGYILALELDEMAESSSIWDNGVENVYVYFPSDGNVNNISATNRTITIDQEGYECKINRATPDGNRTVKDSYWHCIGVPSFANYNSALSPTSGGETIDWSDADGDWSTPNLPYLYEWNRENNSLSVTTSATFDFKATWSYLVQYAGTSIYWSQVNVTPASIVARERTAPTNAEFRIELQQGGEKTDQTFVRLTEEENVTTGFDFNYDLSKEYNKNRANIYTMVTTVKEGVASVTQSAANVLPMSDQTTVVPVGVKIATTGDYTFAIPEGTAGVGVTLIDNETGIRTSLSALDYTINLSAGTYENRFVLEISPIKQMPTDIESVSDQHSAVRKVMIDGILYIVKDGKVFDAHGNRVK